MTQPALYGFSMPTNTPPATPADEAYWRLYADVRPNQLRIQSSPAGIEVNRWTCVAASRTDEDGVERVEEEQIGVRSWDVSIAVRTEDEAKVLAAALGGEYGHLASFTHRDCRWYVSVKRDDRMEV